MDQWVSLYLLSLLPIFFILPILLQCKRSVSFSVLMTWFSTLGVAVLLVSVFSSVPLETVRLDFNQRLDSFIQLNSGAYASFSVEDLDFFKQTLFDRLPSVGVSLSLFLVVAYFVFLVKWKPARFGDSRVLSRWKSPDALVWPTLACAFCLIFPVSKGLDKLAYNLFHVLMAIYAIQGLSILSFFFHAFQVKRIFRILGYAAMFLVMTPFLLGLGFFDLWFDFRSKFKTTGESSL